MEGQDNTSKNKESKNEPQNIHSENTKKSNSEKKEEIEKPTLPLHRVEKNETPEEKKAEIEGSSESASVKDKNSTKKIIKIPKHSDNTAEKKTSGRNKSSENSKNNKMGELYRTYGKRSHGKLRTLKSMSPRKKFYKNNMHSSTGNMSLTSSKGFRTTYGEKINRRNGGANIKSLFTLNRAGPGSYDLPPLLGGFIVQGNKKNHPRYSIGKAQKFSMKNLNKEQAKRNVGIESPGVGSYSPDHNKVRWESPNAKIGREKRFNQLNSTFSLKKNVPHAYLRQDSEALGKKLNGRGFTKEKRFVVVSLKNKDKLNTPAPSQYNAHMYNTISSNFGKFKLKDKDNSHNNSLQDKYHNNIYFKELERCYNNQTSPGPGAYDSHHKTANLSNVRRSAVNSFTKVIILIK